MPHQTTQIPFTILQSSKKNITLIEINLSKWLRIKLKQQEHLLLNL